MKQVWFAAAAMAALSLSAFGAQAREDHDHACLDAACTTQALFDMIETSAANVEGRFSDGRPLRRRRQSQGVSYSSNKCSPRCNRCAIVNVCP